MLVVEGLLCNNKFGQPHRKVTRAGTKPESLVAGVGEVTLDWDPVQMVALGIDEYVVKFSINSAAFVDDNWNSNGPRGR